MIRAASDSDDVLGLIGGCWAEYPGCVLDLDEVPELRALASHYAAKGGALWAGEHDGRAVGVIGVAPLDGPAHPPGTWEIGRLYVARDQRGSGLAGALLDTAEGHARTRGAAALVLWSDTRFERAHAFYERHGYLRSGPIVVRQDRSNTLEFAYDKPLSGIVVRGLDAAAAASAERGLADLLRDCVAAGASVSFLPPLDPAVARGFWQRAAAQVATGKRALLAAWLDGRLAGTVTLDLDTPPNQPHRAEVQKLLVAPWARRRGLGRALMRQAEQAAHNAGRDLLTLDTRAGEAGDALYRGLGFTEAGRIPCYALSADGSFHDTLLFWKRLATQAE